MDESSYRSNRKLIRPDLNKIKEDMPFRKSISRKAPAEKTFAEEYYYLKQMKNRTLMALILKDGEKITGIIEWYDKDSLKVNRDDSPNLLIQKDCIKYMYKMEEEVKPRGRRRL